MNAVAYQHPDGHELIVSRDNHLTMLNADCGDALSIPIGPGAMRELGERLIALSSEAQFTVGDVAEQAGNAIASDCLSEMLNAGTQADRCAILHTALVDLAKMPHHDQAAGGFAVALTAVLSIGLENLPRGGAKE